MELRPLTLEEQFFQKPIYVSALDLTQGGVVPEIESANHIQLDKPQLFNASSENKFIKHLSNNWGWYLGAFIGGMLVANYIINKQQEPKEKDYTNKN